MKIDTKEVEDDILCNITKHELYINIDYDELENFDFVHSDEEQKDNREFSMINPDLLDLGSEVSDSVSNAPVPFVTVDNLLLPTQ